MVSAVDKKPTLAFAFIFLILLAGCGSLPDYSRPRIYPGDTALPALVVAYRDLVVADFQAEHLPDYLRDHSRHMNAHTAVAIRTMPGSHSILTPPDGHGAQMYSGRVENLAFEAVMIPAHSWWNPSLAKERFAYVLQHEQIHFALMEVAARRLTDRAARQQARLTVHDTSNEAVKKRLLAEIDQWLAESEGDVLREHTEFDRATSRRYAPEVQQQWYERVEKELKVSRESD